MGLLPLGCLQSAATPASTRRFEGAVGSAVPAANVQAVHGCVGPCACPGVQTRDSHPERKAGPKDGRACLQGGHFYGRFVARKQRHYRTAGLVRRLQPGVVFT